VKRRRAAGTEFAELAAASRNPLDRPTDPFLSGKEHLMTRSRYARALAVALAAFGLWAWGAGAARAIQPTLVEVKKEKDGTFSYVFKITIDDSVVVQGGKDAPNPDFFTIYNFAGLVAGSNQQPEGWTFSTSDEGVTPFRGGKAMVNPVDTKDIPNVTWSYTGKDPLKGPKEITGFSVRTKVEGTVVGEYGVQVTRLKPGTLNPKDDRDSKEARIGAVTTPEVKAK
jgi:hypothetical protein